METTNVSTEANATIEKRKEYQREYKRKLRAAQKKANPDKPDGRKGTKRPLSSARLKGKPNLRAVKEATLFRLHVPKSTLALVDEFLYLVWGHAGEPTEIERREALEGFVDWGIVESRLRQVIAEKGMA